MTVRLLPIVCLVALGAAFGAVVTGDAYRAHPELFLPLVLVVLLALAVAAAVCLARRALGDIGAVYVDVMVESLERLTEGR
ncbi:MAG: hypothetical protein JWM10_995 [Myxococcaceae bacterium]|nr:hypothetical protein [Myxococcaceae bacterium]